MGIDEPLTKIVRIIVLCDIKIMLEKFVEKKTNSNYFISQPRNNNLKPTKSFFFQTLKLNVMEFHAW